MRKLLCFALGCVLYSFSNAQTIEDTVSLEAGYTNSSYYSLSEGEVLNISNTDWDIAFETSAFGYAIRTNGNTGTELFLYPKDDTSGWPNADTSGLSTWPVLYNSDTSWLYGAFNHHASDLDLGWGNYSTISHHVNGDSIYIIKLSSGAWKKIWIENLQSGVFSFRYADLDGGNEVEATLNKADFSGKNFGYYSLQNNTELDKEPGNSEWDLVFTGYITELAPAFYYGVTGVLCNGGVSVAQANEIDDPDSYENYQAHEFETYINTIGYDWKEFNMGTFTYEVDDSLCYFVNDKEGNIWRLVFTGFDGSSTGKVFLQKTLLSTASGIGTEDITNFALFPNPATDYVNLIYDTHLNQVNVNIYNLQGKEVYSENFTGTGFQNKTLSISSLQQGVYVISLNIGNARITKKLIIH